MAGKPRAGRALTSGGPGTFRPLPLLDWFSPGSLPGENRARLQGWGHLRLLGASEVSGQKRHRKPGTRAAAGAWPADRSLSGLQQGCALGTQAPSRGREGPAFSPAPSPQGCT